jgi:glycerol uptake facilitator-like aquaporin
MHLLNYANKKRLCTWYFWGYVVAQLVEALHYKSESR